MRKYKNNWILFFVLLIIVIIVDFPVITMILNSFKSNSEILSSYSIWPHKFTFENYVSMNKFSKIWIYICNSFIVSISGTIVCVILAAFAGFVLSRFRSPFIRGYSRFLLIMQMFPLILVLIPLFVLFKNLKLLNTYYCLIIIYSATNLAFSTWMYKGFFDSIPKELEEASWIDGCSKLACLFKIILPISGPGITSVAIFTFLNCWNEYMIANIFIRNSDRMTMPVGIQMFMQQSTTDWGSLMSAATIAVIPVFIIFLFFQKYIVNGMLSGAVKG